MCLAENVISTNQNSEKKRNAKKKKTSSTLLCKDPSLPGLSLASSSLSSTSSNLSPASSCKKAWNVKIEELDYYHMKSCTHTSEGIMCRKDKAICFTVGWKIVIISCFSTSACKYR